MRHTTMPALLVAVSVVLIGCQSAAPVRTDGGLEPEMFGLGSPVAPRTWTAPHGEIADVAARNTEQGDAP